MKLNQKTSYVLELNEEEARWLKYLVQNPINVYSQSLAVLEDEEQSNRDMREKFWNMLNNVELF
jgi:hypothetical protein